METLFMDKTLELKREKEFLERKLKVKITINGKKITIDGEPIDEYDARIVLDAMNMGFSAQKAAKLKDGEINLKKMNVKDFTRRKDLEEVRGRLIGKEGKTKRTIEDISGCEIKIKDNTVAILGLPEDIEYASTAVGNVIKGSKQANVYSYLERINREKKKFGN